MSEHTFKIIGIGIGILLIIAFFILCNVISNRGKIKPKINKFVTWKSLVIAQIVYDYRIKQPLWAYYRGLNAALEIEFKNPLLIPRHWLDVRKEIPEKELFYFDFAHSVSNVDKPIRQRVGFFSWLIVCICSKLGFRKIVKFFTSPWITYIQEQTLKNLDKDKILAIEELDIEEFERKKIDVEEYNLRFFGKKNLEPIKNTDSLPIK